MLVSINGEIQPMQTAKISVSDRGFLYGEGVFDVMSACYGQILDPFEHIKRLEAACKEIDIPFPWTRRSIVEEIQAMLRKLFFPKAYIRIMITAGDGFGLFSKAQQPNKVIFIKQIFSAPKKVCTKGVSLSLCCQSSAVIRNIKKLDYSSSIKAVKEAQTMGHDDVLYHTGAGKITESSVSNVFFVRRFHNKLKVLTPPADGAILPGVTRASVLRLLGENKIDFKIRIIKTDELSSFEEVFLSSSVRGLVPVSSINSICYSSCEKQSFFSKIESLYCEYLSTKLGLSCSS
jgi:branched-subunit amino acid aminotransferase/4-amino-4-deoxychorismate lyase